MRLHFREYGAGQPLLILHGLFGSLENWQYISSQLANDFHVLAVDQRNHGQSPHDPEMNYALMAADLEELMQKQGLATAIVMGHSMGGKTAMRFALDFPKRVERLIIVDMAPRAYDAVHEDIFKALLALDLASFKDRRQMDDALEPSIPEARLRSFLLKGLRHDASGAWRWRFNLSDLHRNYARLNGAIHAAQPFVKPALFVRGGESDHVCERDYPEITRLFPNVEIAEIPGAGHWVHAEAPGPFLEIVRNFLSKKIVDRKIIFPA